MDALTPHTTQLHQWLDRLRNGDLSARDEMLRGVGQRLEHLARKMLRKFPGVQRWETTDDVLQNALMRLLRSLGEVQPDSMRAFYGLAAQQIRRELLDLARHYYGPRGEGANHASDQGTPTESARAHEPAAPVTDTVDLQRWTAFHEQVERLPTTEREVVSLVFYHGWTHAEVAEMFNVSERTIGRYWVAAMTQLHATLQQQGLEP